MPRFVRRRRFSRRRRQVAWYNRKYSTAEIARAAWRSAKYIRGLVNSEMFHSDQGCALGNNQNNIFHLTSLAQADTVSGRTGNSVLLKSLVANGYMYVNSSQTTNTRCMIALVLDKQQVSDTNPAITDIFESATDPSTLLKTGNLGRFKILMRKQYTLDSNSSGSPAKQVKIYKPLNFHVRYNGTGASDIQKNGVYLVYITSESSLYPTIHLNTRISYHDN